MTAKTNKENWILLGLIALHAALLLFRYSEIPFSHDELSALYRCRFTNFNELIKHGVMPDGHPAGVQTLLWLLTRTFVYTEWILKLPFIIAGIICTFFLYKSTQIMFNKYTATLASILFISSEFFLTQQAYTRPYSLGLMFNLILLFLFLKTINKKSSLLNYLLIALFSSLSYYTHYFSFLQSLILWLSVFIVFNKQINYKYFMSSFVLSILLFIPHLGITKHQLSMGGLGWLGTPSIRFIGHFYLQLFNGSYTYLALGSVLLFLSLFQYKKFNKTYCFLILLWLLPFSILWIYSVFNAPVLQNIALYFSTPFLIILISNSIHIFSKNRTKILLVLTVLTTALISLVYSKHFFKQRYYSPIKTFINQSNSYLEKNPKDSVLILWQGNTNYFSFYNSKLSHPLNVIFTDTCNHINTSNYQQIICNELTPNKMVDLAQKFPYIYTCEYGFLNSFYVLKNRANNTPMYNTLSELQFPSIQTKEWSESFSFNLLDEGVDKNSFLELIPHLDSTISNSEIVMEIYDKDTRIDWRSIPLEPNKILSAKLKDIIKTDKVNHTYSVKIYIWNKDKKNIPTLNASLKFRADNPYEYVGKY